MLWLPELVRRVTVAQIRARTERPVSIEAVDLNLLTGRFTIRGFRLAERDGTTPFADFERLDVRVHLPSLLLGHLWIREVVLSDSTVRVVRLANEEFNVSDLCAGGGGAAAGGRGWGAENSGSVNWAFIPPMLKRCRSPTW